MTEIKSAEEVMKINESMGGSYHSALYFKQERDQLRAAYEALHKENELHKAHIKRLTDSHDRLKEDAVCDAKTIAAQAKRIEEHLELIEATAEFSKAFWEKADKHNDTRVMVSTFQQLERKLRTYLPASKNGE